MKLKPRTIVALAYSQVYHYIAKGRVTLCGLVVYKWEGWRWETFSEPPPDLRECKRCQASPRRSQAFQHQKRGLIPNQPI